MKLNRLRRTLASWPSIKGKGCLLRFLDRLLGPAIATTPLAVKLPVFFSSTQDLSFMDWNKEKNPRLVESINDLPHGGVYVDVGANIGYYSAYAAKVVGKTGTILSFEPSTREFVRLNQTRQINPHECHWEILNSPVGEKSPEYVYLDCFVGHTGMNRISSNKEQPARSRKYKTVALDDIVQVYGIESIDLLKVDVEGYEMSALQGAKTLLSEKRVRKIVVEVTESFLIEMGSSKKELYDFLATYGYRPLFECDDPQYDDVFIQATS
ncbi:MAG: FkbM family methyltransferase [Luteolibacter sp.]